MKRYEFDLSLSAQKLFFPEERVKTKLQVIDILMEATRYMLANPTIAKTNITGKLVLLVDRMSRLFFFKEGKHYSIVFPFLVSEIEGTLHFSFQNNLEVDSQLISNTISTISCDSFKDKCSLDFIEPIYDYENEFDDNFWIFLRELLLNEDGYIRYDRDEKSYQEAKEKGEEHKHPLNHFDVFYSSNATFKLGLHSESAEEQLIDLLNTKTDCKYLRE
ncbi:hypothetical protein [Prolixibacter sp. NT017]|uniref:hypothetical protein n=1 Tax=Prolixibacter sp. NT017 TaxID=2652390 RepID=UPI0012722DE7|nr:hypothetical protein [Prolixibacter sp. NT017]GET25510.1 hypothetical protein NT017_18390 [Prolixibacter sp. NT017]